MDKKGFGSIIGEERSGEEEKRRDQEKKRIIKRRRGENKIRRGEISRKL